MGIISIILFLLEYGPAIVKLIMAAIDLIKWLRRNDNALAFGDDKQVKTTLTVMAKRCKAAKDHTELETYVAKLKERKAEVEARRSRNVDPL